ncbi:hypothetical protein PV326_011195 [Microctonus aethiopoides]|nr:hypothetical protein PV326_011195 [Microctonus aethiopoides]
MMRSILEMECKVGRQYYRFGDHAELIGNRLHFVTSQLSKAEKCITNISSHLKKIIIRDGTREGISSKIYKLLNNNLNNFEFSCCSVRSYERCLKYLPKNNFEHLSVFVGLPSSLRTADDYETVAEQMEKHTEKALSKMPKLKYLNLNHVPIKQLFLSKGMETLRALYIQIPELLNINSNINKLKIFENLEILYQEYPETTLNVMISLPNLRRLYLSTKTGSYKSWQMNSSSK